MAYDLPDLEPDDPSLLELDGVEVRPQALAGDGQPLTDLLTGFGLPPEAGQVAADLPDGWRTVGQWPPRHAQDATLDFVAAPFGQGWRVLHVFTHPDGHGDVRVGSHCALAKPGAAARRAGLELRWLARPGHTPTPDDLGLTLLLVNVGGTTWTGDDGDTVQAAAWFVDEDGTQLGEDGFAYRVDGSQAMPRTLEPGAAVELPFSCDLDAVRGRSGPVGIYAWHITLRLRSRVQVLTFS